MKAAGAFGQLQHCGGRAVYFESGWLQTCRQDTIVKKPLLRQCGKEHLLKYTARPPSWPMAPGRKTGQFHTGDCRVWRAKCMPGSGGVLWRGRALPGTDTGPGCGCEIPGHNADNSPDGSRPGAGRLLIGICGVGVIGAGWYVRRWWIHRQNKGAVPEVRLKLIRHPEIFFFLQKRRVTSSLSSGHAGVFLPGLVHNSYLGVSIDIVLYPGADCPGT
jgi:hypothetical protein